jgi:hypothetical protein
MAMPELRTEFASSIHFGESQPLQPSSSSSAADQGDDRELTGCLVRKDGGGPPRPGGGVAGDALLSLCVCQAGSGDRDSLRTKPRQ